MRHRIDKSQKQIIEQLRKLGCSVYSTASIGNGFPDLVIGFRGKTYLAEVKTPKTNYGKSLSDSQIKFKQTWAGAEVILLRSVEDFLALLQTECSINFNSQKSLDTQE